MAGSGFFRSAARWFLFASVLFVFLLSGCAPDYVGNAAPANAKSCDLPEAKIYTGDNTYPDLQGQQVKEAANRIFAIAPQNIAVARREALRLLEYETQRWSDAQYVAIKDKPNMRVIATLLGPGVVRAIVLNELLATNYNFDPANPPNLDQITNQALAKMGVKNDFAFMLIIQTQPDSASTPRTFKFALPDIILHNTTGRQTLRTRGDDFLDTDLKFADGKFAGLIFFPAAAQEGVQVACSPVLDPVSETSLMLTTSSLRVDDVTGQKVTWIFYFPLLSGLNSELLKLDLVNNPANGEDTFAYGLKEPPDVTRYDKTETINWRDVGRYIWWKLTMDHIPLK